MVAFRARDALLTALGVAAVTSCLLSREGSPVAAATASGTSSSSTSGGESASSAGGAGGEGGMGGAGGKTPGCGNLQIDPGEQCDDGNKKDGDGCSSLCFVEMADVCPGAKVTLSPPGITMEHDTSKAKDDYAPYRCKTTGTGTPDAVYAVTPTVAGTLVATVSATWSPVIYARRSCQDDTPLGELDCETSQLTLWVQPGVTYYLFVDGQGTNDKGAFSLGLTLLPCGNSFVEGLEECDDPMDPACIGCLKCDNPDEFSDTPLPVGFARGHCYHYEGVNPQPWLDARNQCIKLGGDLTVPGNYFEAVLLQGKIAGQDAWIGGDDLVKEGDFHWADGEAFRYARWDFAQPDNSGGNENCVDMHGTGLLNDDNCTFQKYFVCERFPAGKCGDGVVQGIEECDDGNDVPGDGCTGCVVDCAPADHRDPDSHHCYHYVDVAADWSSAELGCQAWGGHLAAIQSEGESRFVDDLLFMQLMKGTSWVDGFDVAGNLAFYYRSGEPMIYTRWDTFEPNNLGIERCVELKTNGLWNNAQCTVTHPYLCERSPAGAD